MTDHLHTDEQQAIFDRLSQGNDHMLIDALAGSGKTTILLDALRFVPQKSVLLTAFNKRIAQELEERLPQKIKGSFWATATFHSAGFKILSKKKPGLEVSKSATEDLVNEAATAMAANGSKVNFKTRRATTNLLRILKETFAGPEVSFDDAKEIGNTYSYFIELEDDEIEQACYLVQAAYDLGLYIKDRTAIDYCDMIWLPVVLDLSPPSRYQAVFVDEMQDLSLLQWELIKKLVAPQGRIVGVGDRRQSVYSWRGAIGNLVTKELEASGIIRMPLTTSFRCSRAVVAEAQKIVPELKACSTARDGRVARVDFSGMIVELGGRIQEFSGQGQTAMVLSRTNHALLAVALQLWIQEIDFRLLGAQEILEPLRVLAEKFDKSSQSRFENNVRQWSIDEMRKAEAAQSPAWADRVEQQSMMLLAIIATVSDPNRIVGALRDLVGVSTSNLLLSTVHKAKGLEAEHVYLLEYTFPQFQDRKEPVAPEEHNLLYVAITRAMNTLTYVNTTVR